MRARGIEALREDIANAIPALTDSAKGLKSIDDVKLLDIRINRLRRWYVDGLLCIGDAAHAMSPAGGVGINLAVQDAVAAATLLAQPLLQQRVTTKDLAAVQRRRNWPTQAVQTGQILGHRLMLDRVLARKNLYLKRGKTLLSIAARFPQLSVIPAIPWESGYDPSTPPIRPPNATAGRLNESGGFTKFSSRRTVFARTSDLSLAS